MAEAYKERLLAVLSALKPSATLRPSPTTGVGSGGGGGGGILTPATMALQPNQFLSVPGAGGGGNAVYPIVQPSLTTPGFLPLAAAATPTSAFQMFPSSSIYEHPALATVGIGANRYHRQEQILTKVLMGLLLVCAFGLGVSIAIFVYQVRDRRRAKNKDT